MILRASDTEYPGRFISVIRTDGVAPRASSRVLTAGKGRGAPRIEILRQIWARGAVRLREGGLGELLANALAVLGVRRVLVYRIEQDAVLARGAPVAGVALQGLSDREVDADVGLWPRIPASEVNRRLQQGAECVTAWRDGRLVAARWAMPGRAEIGYLGTTLRLRPGVWYAFDAVTRPEERRQGISAMVTAALVLRVKERGATELINAVIPENRGGRGLARRRSRPLGVLRSVRLGRWHVLLAWLEPGYLGAPMPLESAPAPRAPADQA